MLYKLPVNWNIHNISVIGVQRDTQYLAFPRMTKPMQHKSPFLSLQTTGVVRLVLLKLKFLKLLFIEALLPQLCHLYDLPPFGPVCFLHYSSLHSDALCGLCIPITSVADVRHPNP
uniref:Uncharacterized protein n=1 Tax=Megaselia scalaris TaxID=36166 RepID=T1GCU2_MEGSC